MKLQKDQFVKREIDLAANKIVDVLIDYVMKNKLFAHRSGQLINLNTVQDHFNHDFNLKIHDFKKFMKQEFILLDPDDMSSSHNIIFTQPDKMCFYKELLGKLNDFEKIVLVKTVNTFKHPIAKLNNEISEDDYWLHLRHVAPFSKIKQPSSSDYVKNVLTTLENKSIDTQEKIDSLAYFLNYYKPIAKRTDIKASVIKLIKRKINEEHFPMFESILGSQISKDNSEINLFLNPTEVKTLIISKNSIFEQVTFDKIPQAAVHHYNTYLQFINYFLLSPKTSDILNISRIDFHEFQSNNEPARIYISSNQDGFNEDLGAIYQHLIQSCSPLYKQSRFSTSNTNDDILNSFKTSLDYFLLNKSILESNNNSNNIEEPKRKNFKL